MSQLKVLTAEQVERFASRKGAKRIAVENFLTSCNSDRSDAASNAIANARNDAKSYGWNAATLKAIIDGIILAQGE